MAVARYQLDIVPAACRLLTERSSQTYPLREICLRFKIFPSVDLLPVVAQVCLQAVGSQQEVDFFFVVAPRHEHLLFEMTVVKLPRHLVTARHKGRFV